MTEAVFGEMFFKSVSFGLFQTSKKKKGADVGSKHPLCFPKAGTFKLVSMSVQYRNITDRKVANLKGTVGFRGCFKPVDEKMTVSCPAVHLVGILTPPPPPALSAGTCCSGFSDANFSLTCLTVGWNMTFGVY